MRRRRISISRARSARRPVPTFHAARIPDVATARHAIAEGKLDMVGMTRAHIADPHIVAKVIEGREDDIRPCVGATYCLDRIYEGGDGLCIHNPRRAARRRCRTTSRPPPAPRRVVIVGAGPAGWRPRASPPSAAISDVFEAADRARRPGPPGRAEERRREMIGIIDWRMAQCERCTASTFRFNTLPRPRTFSRTDPDEVIVATGGLPHTEVLEEGNELVFRLGHPVGRREARRERPDLRRRGRPSRACRPPMSSRHRRGSVEIVTPDRSFAPEVMAMNLVPYMRSLQRRTSPSP
jgi:N-methyl-L-proline demethylase